MWCKSLTLEKYISFRMKWFFSPPFLSVSPFLLLNLVRRQCYAYAIGLYTRTEIKSWLDVKFCAHAHCVLPQCCLCVTLRVEFLSKNSLHCHVIGSMSCSLTGFFPPSARKLNRLLACLADLYFRARKPRRELLVHCFPAAQATLLAD